MCTHSWRCALVLALTLAGLVQEADLVRADRALAGKGPGASVVLPPPNLRGTMSLEEALATRRSQRRVSDEALSVETIGQLLWAAQGITLPQRGFRTAPSAGARYPLRVYVLTATGLYAYQARGHLLRLLEPTDLRAALWAGVYARPWLATAPAMFLIAADYRSTTAKYGPKARRFVHIEAGHAAQNLLLQSTALGLHALGVGAFDPVRSQKILDLPKEQELLYVLVVGKPPTSESHSPAP